MEGFDLSATREQFPALAREVAGRPAVFVDGPGGTQAPTTVIDAMARHLSGGSANLGGPFVTSAETGDVVDQARAAMADLFGAASPREIVFGQNMTSLTFAMSRALGRAWGPNDEIVVTSLDHDANVSPWREAANEAGAHVRTAEFDPGTGKLDAAAFDAVLTDRTRLVAVTHASNAIGTVVDVAAVVERAHSVGALVYVDAVHYAPHGLIDVGATGCDFLAASAYKFFGPHAGALYGRLELLESVDAIKVRPSPAHPPGKWETGTQSFESIAGIVAAVGYVESLGAGASRRRRLQDAMDVIRTYEGGLGRRFIDGVEAVDGVHIHGIPSMEGRTPTFAVSVDSRQPADVAASLGEQGIFVWHGDYYAPSVMDRLGVAARGGLVRIGFVHYNTVAEVDRVLAALAALA